MNRIIRLSGIIISLIVILTAFGCSQRELVINAVSTDGKPIIGAEVHINHHFAGKTPLTASYEDYGDYAFEIRANGFGTNRSIEHIGVCWYGWEPFRLLVDLLPITFTDTRELSFQLKPRTKPTAREKRIIRNQALRNVRRIRTTLNAASAE